MRRQAGFTLLEMLVTLAILGLALTVAARTLGGMGSGRRLAHLSELIAAEIGLLRAEALRTGRSGRLVFEARSGRFVSSRVGAVPIAATASQVSLETADAERPGGAEIRFLPDGSSTGARIVLEDAAARLVVTVDALTGRVRRGGGR